MASRLTEEQQLAKTSALNLQDGQVLVVNSVAGSGKTRTLKNIGSALTDCSSVLMMAFNVSIAAELSKDAISGEIVKTFHSWIKAETKGYLFLDPDIKPVKALTSTISNRSIRYPIELLVTAMINAGYGLPGNNITIEEVFKTKGILKPKNARVEEIYRYAGNIFDQLIRRVDNNNFDLLLWNYADMLISGKIEIITNYERVLVDEFQDFNYVQLRILQEIQKKNNCAIVFVGDENQAIYQFRGACDETLNKIYEMFNVVKEVHLTKSFRCSGEVIKIAQKYVSRIKGDAEPGKVFYVTEDFLIEKAEITDMVLCRFNKRLMDVGLKLVSKGIPVLLKNTKIITEVFNQLEYSKFKSLAALHSWVKTELETARTLEDIASRSARCDFVETVSAIGEKILRKEETFDSIKEKFLDGNESNSVILSTIHMAKGREFNRVYFLDYLELTKKAMIKAELNAIYVGVTRAINELYLL
jgi:F-box protein 18 (helicase)